MYIDQHSYRHVQIVVKSVKITDNPDKQYNFTTDIFHVSGAKHTEVSHK